VCVCVHVYKLKRPKLRQTRLMTVVMCLHCSCWFDWYWWLVRPLCIFKSEWSVL